MTNWKQEAKARAEVEAMMPGLCSDIAKFLPGNWTCAQPNENLGESQRLTRDDGLTLSLDAPLYRSLGRVEISGCLPGRANGASLSRYDVERAKDITCAIKRGPEAIARDIEVRLLADAARAHEAGLKAAKRLDEAHERRMAVHRHIAGLFGQQAGERGRSEYGHFEGITCTVTHPQSFEISVRATDPEEATRIITKLSRITGYPLIKEAA